MAHIAGMDVGGTRLRVAVAAVEAPDQILSFRESATPQDGPAAVVDLACSMLEECASEPVEAVACVAPGMTDVHKGRVLDAANLNGWQNVPLRSLLEARSGLAAVVGNDVNAAALAEGAIGAGKGANPMAFITISTGVAAGFVINGQIVHGAHCSAGELGNLLPDQTHVGRDWRPNGSLELHAAGMGLARQWAQLRGGDSHAKRAIEVFDAADSGDAEAQRLIGMAADYLAQSAVAIAAVLDPACIVVGGSIGLARPEIVERMREVLKLSVVFPPRVVRASLGGQAPLMGALHLARSYVVDLDSGGSST